VCIVFCKGYPEDLNGKEITVPENTVALSERVLVGTPTKIEEAHENYVQQASILFIIDNSGSMESSIIDRKGYRFTVPFTLMDTIQKRCQMLRWVSLFLGQIFTFMKMTIPIL
jgi:hypothetical protein